MKKILFIIIVLFVYLLSFGVNPSTIFATPTPAGPTPTMTEIEKVFGRISPPPQIGDLGQGEVGISRVLSNIIVLIYMVSSVIFVFMVIISGLQWILSGGDKEAVAGARKRLTYAIIGIVFLALAFILLKTFGQVTGFEFFGGQNLPVPTPTP